MSLRSGWSDYVSACLPTTSAPITTSIRQVRVGEWRAIAKAGKACRSVIWVNRAAAENRGAEDAAARSIEGRGDEGRWLGRLIPAFARSAGSVLSMADRAARRRLKGRFGSKW